MFSVLCLASCGKSGEPASGQTNTPVKPIELPKADGAITDIGVSTGDATGVALRTATLGINVDRNVSVTEFGVAYSTNLNDLKRKKAWHKKGTNVADGKCSFSFDNLYTGATYYYAAYSQIKGSFYYGDVKSFQTTAAKFGESVDLGLSVYWCDRNLGATGVTDAGNLYYWAEAIPAGATSMYEDISYSEHNVPSISGTESDAAYVAMGGRWRMPTQKEALELVQNCKWELVTVDGVKVYKVTSKYYESRSIYIPFNKTLIGDPTIYHKEHEQTYSQDWDYEFWTGTQYDITGNQFIKTWRYAWSSLLDSDTPPISGSMWYMTDKYSGLAIRPVYEPMIIN